MGYLNNAVITVDAILTTKGREAYCQLLLHNMQNQMDGLDYKVYNQFHHLLMQIV